MRIAAVVDSTRDAEIIKKCVLSIGHKCHIYQSGKSVIKALRRESFDFLLIDWHLPDISGTSVVLWVRQHYETHIPILLLTSRTDEKAIVQALAVGADDFMCKPIRINELVARIKALIRRFRPDYGAKTIVRGPFNFNTVNKSLEISGVVLDIKAKEFDLAVFLFQNIGRTLSRRHLIEKVWGLEAVVTSRTLDTHISEIRNKLVLKPENGFKLHSVYSVGYRLDANDELTKIGTRPLIHSGLLE